MLVVTNLQGHTESLLDINGVEVVEQVNGEYSLSFVCFNTENNRYAYPLVQEESIVELDGHKFRIKQMTEVRDRKEVHAQHIFFDLVDHYQGGTFGGTHTLDEFTQFALNGTGWTFENVDVTGRAFIPNFGEGNVVALIRQICDAFGCEVRIMPGKHLRFAKQIGADKDEQFRYKHNIKTLRKSVDTTKLATAIKGYGANGLVVEYHSPNEAIYGTRWAEPIKDDRYTIAESLTKRLKQELVDVPEVSIELELSQLGFDVGLGDRVWVIYEPLGIDFQTRVMEVKRYPFTKRSPAVTLSNKKRVFTDIWTETKVDIEESKKETRSKIEQTNERITLEVERIDDSISTLQVEADNIQLSVRQLDGRVGNAEATLSIHADEISTKVSKNGVISAINQTAEQIKIQASKIELIGTTNIQDASITDAKIVSLTANKITAGTIDTSQVTVQGTNGKLRISGNRLQVFDDQQTPVERVSLGDVNGDGTVYGLKVRSADGTTVLYDHNGVYSAGITDGAITTAKIADGAIDSSKLADLSITAAKLKNGIIDDKKLADLAVTAAKLADSAVTSSKIDSGAKQEIVDTANQYTNTYAEKKIAKGNTAPSNPAVGDLWIDTSVTPNLLKRWTGSEWQKLAPTTASEIGAVDLSIYNTKVQQLTNDIAAKADATWVNGQLQLKENAITKSNTAPSNPATGQLWLDTSVTPNVLNRWNGSAWVKVTPTSAGEVGAYTKTEVDNALNSKVSVTQYNTDMNGVVTRLNSAESRITQNEKEIATKVSNTTYQQDKAALENDISALETRMSNAETSITQNANQIELKANKTDVYTKQEVNNQLANKADNSTVSAIEQRVTQAEAQLTVQAGEIASKVSRTEYDIDVNNLKSRMSSAESQINWKESWEPDLNKYTTTGKYFLKGSLVNSPVSSWAYLTVEAFSDGRIVQTIRRDNDTLNWQRFKFDDKWSDWIRLADSNDINNLGSRLSTAESSITQLSNQITLKVNQSQYDIDVNNLKSRMSSAESQLTIQADQIATKVEKNGVVSAINQTPESIKIQASKIELIGTTNIEDGAITSAKIAEAAVGNAAIANGAITSAKIVEAAVGTAAIADGAITNAKIANLAVDTAKIADAAITDAKIANISANKITTGTLDANIVNITGKLTSVTIDVSTDAQVGDNLYLGVLSDYGKIKSIFFNDVANITGGFGSTGADIEINAATLWLDGEKVIFGDRFGNRATVDFTGCTVKGLNVVAKFG